MTDHESADTDLVTASLLADVASIDPAKPFRVGVRFSIADRTHVYWRNPGDSGLPSGVEWLLPEGFEVGPLQWPAPIRFEIAEIGDVSYGFKQELFLFAELKPPAGLEAGSSVTLKAAPYWLACMEDGQCIPGGAELELVLPIGDGAPSTDGKEFADAELDLPRPIESVSAQIRLGYNDTRLEFESVGPWEFAPGPLEWAFPFEGGRWDSTAPGSTGTILFVSTDPDAQAFAGVVTVTLTIYSKNVTEQLSVQIGEAPAEP